MIIDHDLTVVKPVQPAGFINNKTYYFHRALPNLPLNLSSSFDFNQNHAS